MKLSDYKNIIAKNSKDKYKDLYALIRMNYFSDFNCSSRHKARESMKEAGFDFSKLKSIGSGHFGAAYINKQTNTVLKVCRDIAYIEYARLAMQHHHTNPYFPEILSITPINDFFVVEMKKYNRVSDYAWNNNWNMSDVVESYHGGYSFKEQCQSINEAATYFNDEHLKEWLKLVKSSMSKMMKTLRRYNVKPNLHFDIHGDNIMRSKDRFVITDPVYLEF